VRVFPGQEIHPHHQYGLDEGNSDVTRDSRRHIATMGCPTIICDANMFEEDIIRRIHETGGLAIVAHPNPGDPWWTKAHEGHYCDGVCLDTGDFKSWDMMLMRNAGVLYPAVRGSDSGPGEWGGGPANTAWLREPLSMRSLMKAAVNGRISFLYPRPGDFSTADSFIWFDINGQRMGGTVYASTCVSLNVRSKSHLRFSKVDLVMDGLRGKSFVKTDGDIEISRDMKVDAACRYYRIEAFAETLDPDAWTNPIFVRQIDAPPNAWLYFDKDPDFIFNRELGRFTPNAPLVSESRYDGRLWVVDVFDPEPSSALKFGGLTVKSCRIDGVQASLEPSGVDGHLLHCAGGRHRIEILS
jgi:hypothetical protein